jgi:putative ATP-dependent endonuclease of OLD family
VSTEPAAGHENNQEFKEFTAATNERLKEFTDPANVSALANISDSLSAILKKYYAESDLIATWQPISEYPIIFPSSEIAVKDHGFQSTVERVGHGLQRAIIITILEFLARERLRNPEQKEKEFKKPESDIIVAIEEPEIYQHPIKQRHISNVLGELTSSFSAQTGIRIQIVLATHSPLFVHLPRFQEIRMARRSREEPNDVVVSKLTISECSAGLAKLHDPAKKPMGDAAFASKLHIFDADLSEGFFSKKIILVEGPSDKSILEAALTIQGRSAMAEGLTILAVGGKKILDKPAYIFNALGVPTYVILDNDSMSAQDKAAEIYYNKFLQRVLGVSEDKAVDWPAGVFERWAAWDGNIEDYISTTCGADRYEKVKSQMMIDFEVDSEDCVKSPVIAAAMLTNFVAQGIKFDNLNKIIEMVDRL